MFLWVVYMSHEMWFLMKLILHFKLFLWLHHPPSITLWSNHLLSQFSPVHMSKVLHIHILLQHHCSPHLVHCLLRALLRKLHLSHLFPMPCRVVLKVQLIPCRHGPKTTFRCHVNLGMGPFPILHWRPYLPCWMNQMRSPPHLRLLKNQCIWGKR